MIIIKLQNFFLPYAEKPEAKNRIIPEIKRKNLPQGGVDMHSYPVSIIIIPAKQSFSPQGTNGQTSTSNGHKLHGYEG